MKAYKLIFVFIILLFTSCASNKTNEIQNSTTSMVNDSEDFNITYNNIAGNESLNRVIDLLKGKISNESLNTFINDVKDYSNIVKDLNDNFIVKNELPEYDLVKITGQLESSNSDYYGNNCRITTYGLINEFISLDSVKEIPDNLIFDNDSLSHSNKFDKKYINKFNALYKQIDTEKTKDLNVHLNNIKNYFKKINLKFNLPENFSVISVFFHDDINENAHKLFVGHTGLLIKDNDDYYFIEKLSFELPYQVVKFKNRDELNTYLMTMYNTSWGQETADPIIIENDDLLKEYKVIKNTNAKYGKTPYFAF